MGRYLLGRVGQAFFSIFVIVTLVFALVRLTGDPSSIYVDERALVEVQERVRERLGLDRPLYEQYGTYIAGLITLDLGESFTGRPVLEIILERLPATVSLALVAMGITLLVGVPLGIMAAVYRNSVGDTFARGVALLGQSIPSFVLAIMLVLAFAVWLPLFPVAFRSGPSSYILPAVTMAGVAVAGVVRLIRSSMLDVLDSDYVRMARAKGLSTRSITIKYAFRSALIPILTYTGLLLGIFMNGSVVVESIFGWPGVGKMVLDSVSIRDFPVVQGAVIMIAIIFITINLIVDVLYALLDPRIRYR